MTSKMTNQKILSEAEVFTEAAELIRICKHSMLDPKTASIFFSTFGYSVIKFFTEKKTDTQAYLLERDKTLILVFRATESWQDKMIDIDFFHRDTRIGRAHGGFVTAFKSVHWTIDEILFKYMDEGYDFVVCGHSLGGALAQIAAGDNLLIQPDRCYTFGSPRAYSKKAARAFRKLPIAKSTYRFAIGGDLITRLPPPKLNFRHVGKLMYFDVSGKYRSSIRKWMRAVDIAMDIVHEFLSGTILQGEDHSSELYYKYIDKAKEDHIYNSVK